MASRRSVESDRAHLPPLNEGNEPSEGERAPLPPLDEGNEPPEAEGPPPLRPQVSFGQNSFARSTSRHEQDRSATSPPPRSFATSPSPDPHAGAAAFGRPRRSATTPNQRPAEVPARTASIAGVSTSRNRGRTTSSRPLFLDPPAAAASRVSPGAPSFRDVFARNADLAQEIAMGRVSTASDRPRMDTTSAVRHRRRGHTITNGRAPSIAFATGRADQQDLNAFSLAGPQESLPANQPFIQPGYADLNPAYEQPVNNRPVWGLAKPLPRVIRPGMVPTLSELRERAPPIQPQAYRRDENRANADLEAQQTEPTLQPTLSLGRVGTQLQQAREHRENRLIQRLGSLSSRRVTSNETMQSGVLTPPREVPNEDQLDEEGLDLGLHHFKTDEPTNAPELGPPHLDGARSSGEQQPRQSNETTRRQDIVGIQTGGESGAEPAPWTTVGFDDSASTIHEDLKEGAEHDPDWVYNELLAVQDHGADEEIHNFHTHWSVIRTKFREPLAELLAVVVQLTLGFCSDLAVTASNKAAGNEETTDWAWGLATMTGVYIAGGISGAHLNPAISIMLYIYRGFPLRKVPSYILAQVLGGFIAAMIAFGLYHSDIVNYDAGASLADGGTLSSFITFPRYDFVDACQAFFNELVGSAFLAVAVLALGDDTNAPPGAGMSAFVIGLVVTVLSMAFGYNTGAALNPSRDFGPRLALYAVGYGSDLFTDPSWCSGPRVAPICGTILGGALYDVMIYDGGESPVNYPKRRIRRAGRKWKQRWGKRLKAIRKERGEKGGEKLEG